MNRDNKDVDIVLLRRKRRRRRQITKFTVFAVIAMLGITAYVKSDEWFPALEGIGGRFQSVTHDKDNTDGEFHLSISGGIDYQVGNLNDYLAILSDAYLYIYNQDGELYEERQHAYANAMLQTAGKKALIYESGGNHFRVDSRRKSIFSEKLEDTILFARISENGNTAVITNSDNYLCRLIVFDESGNEIYNRNCVERVVDLAFNENGTGCILATSDAKDGELVTNLVSVSFDSKEDKWSSETINTLCIRTYYDENGVFLIGDNKCAYYDNNGVQKLTYDYPSGLVDWDCNEYGVALLFEDETKRQSYVTTISSSKAEITEKKYDISGSRCIQLVKNSVLVMNKNGITRYGFKGTNEKNLTELNSYDEFMVIEDYIFLLGYDRIERIDYDENP